jgi:hypothetical protein
MSTPHWPATSSTLSPSVSRSTTLLPKYVLANWRVDRNTKIEDVYGHLELSIGEGKRLSADMRKLLKEPPLLELVQRPGNGVSETKRTLVNMSFYMLVSKGWGPAWFGEDCRTAKTRTLFWPDDSSL